MFLFVILRFLLLAAIAIVLVTQLVLPPFIGKPFFFSFRKSEKKIKEAEDDLSTARDELEEKMVTAESKLIRKEVRELDELTKKETAPKRKRKKRS